MDQIRKIAVVYEIINKTDEREDMFVVTVVYSSELDNVLKRRVKSGRWVLLQ